MPYATLDCKVKGHPKFLAAGATASWLWTLALLYCKEHTTDGKIKLHELRQLPFVDHRGRRLNHNEHAKILARERLFDRIKGGYQIHDFAVVNMLRSGVLAVRSGNELRKLLYSHPAIVTKAKARAKGCCECCTKTVSWTDRRSHQAASLQLRNKRTGITLANVYVTCRACQESGKSPKRHSTKVQAKAGTVGTSSRTSSGAKSDQDPMYKGTKVQRYRGSIDDQIGTDPSVHQESSPDPDPSIKAGASPRNGHKTNGKTNGHALSDPLDNVSVITRIAHEALDELPHFAQMPDGLLDLTENIKTLCARRHIGYDSGVVDSAIKSALYQRRARES